MCPVSRVPVEYQAQQSTINIVPLTSKRLGRFPWLADGAWRRSSVGDVIVLRCGGTWLRGACHWSALSASSSEGISLFRPSFSRSHVNFFRGRRTTSQLLSRGIDAKQTKYMFSVDMWVFSLLNRYISFIHYISVLCLTSEGLFIPHPQIESGVLYESN